MRKEASSSIQADPTWKIGIVRSEFYKEEMDKLVEGAIATLTTAGVGVKNISVHEAPGSFEVPLIGSALLEAKKVDAVIGLGIIVEGETHHAQLLAEAAAKGIMDSQLVYLAPFAFEILYVEDIEQVQERLDKGSEAAYAVLKALSVLKGI